MVLGIFEYLLATKNISEELNDHLGLFMNYAWHNLSTHQLFIFTISTVLN